MKVPDCPTILGWQFSRCLSQDLRSLTLDAYFFRRRTRFYKFGFCERHARVCKYGLKSEHRVGSRFAVMYSRAIPHDAMEPGEERGAPLKLMQIPKGQQKAILQGIL